MNRLRGLRVTAHPVAVAAEFDDVAPMEQPVQQGGGHDLVAEDPAPVDPADPTDAIDAGRPILITLLFLAFSPGGWWPRPSASNSVRRGAGPEGGWLPCGRS